jgi:hypothetical protein
MTWVQIQTFYVELKITQKVALVIFNNVKKLYDLPLHHPHPDQFLHH